MYTLPVDTKALHVHVHVQPNIIINFYQIMREWKPIKAPN